MSCAVSQQTLSTPTLPLAELDLRGSKAGRQAERILQPSIKHTVRKGPAPSNPISLLGINANRRQQQSAQGRGSALPSINPMPYHAAAAALTPTTQTHPTGPRPGGMVTVVWPVGSLALHVSALPYQGSCSHLFLVPGGLRRREFETKRAGPLVWPLDDFQVDVVGMVGFVSCLVLAGYARAVGCGCGLR